MVDAEQDTDRVDMLVQILDQLAEINSRLSNIEADVLFIRNEQRNAGRRLVAVEEACADQPLHSTPPPRPIAGSKR